MLKQKSLILLVAVLSAIAIAGCQGSGEQKQMLSNNPLAENTPTIRSQIISVDQLPEFDLSRTYFYQFSSLENPESLLISLWNAGIPISQAWLPLDDQCMNPIGVRFTVELTGDDARIGGFGFIRGVGYLACATQLKRYTISE